MINFYVGLLTGLLICCCVLFIANYYIDNIVLKVPKKEKVIQQKIEKEPIKLDIETAVNNIMEYNEDVALQDIKKRRG